MVDEDSALKVQKFSSSPAMLHTSTCSRGQWSEYVRREPTLNYVTVFCLFADIIIA